MLNADDYVKDTWRQGFHVMPATGWLNDPNGLCQFNGVYHVFFQYWPDWPEGTTRGWGHVTSRDLTSWEWHGLAVQPDTPADRSGAYSGSAYVRDGKMHLLYTGNVRDPEAGDGITAGREANVIAMESEDGVSLSPKRTLLTSADYPQWCSCHVRDPKVWDQDGSLHMLLGARGLDGAGAALVYDSPDGDAWTYRRAIRATGRSGYMWECPDRVELGGHEFLCLCPQGLEHGEDRFQNVYQSGYLPVDGKVLDLDEVCAAELVEWDLGFDFYAPQTFVDQSGRTILIGWMGLPDTDYDNPSASRGWVHCLTVPRELSRDGDAIRQRPVPELDALHERRIDPVRGCALVEGGRADLRLADITSDAWKVTLACGPSDRLTMDFVDGHLSMSLEGRCGAGRTVRHAPVSHVSDLRMLVDSSSVEVFANDGSVVMSTRWYPTEPSVRVSLDVQAGSTTLWTMADSMGDMMVAALA